VAERDDAGRDPGCPGRGQQLVDAVEPVELPARDPERGEAQLVEDRGLAQMIAVRDGAEADTDVDLVFRHDRDGRT
jgi:hypothetical protein